MLLGIKEFEQQILFKVVRAGRVAGGRADSLVLLCNEGIVGELFAGGVAPEFSSDALVEAFGKGLGEAVSQRLKHQGAVVVVGVLEGLGALVDSVARGHRKESEGVAARGVNEVRQSQVGLTLGFLALLAQGEEAALAVWGGHGDVVAILARREESVDAVRGNPLFGDHLLQHYLGVVKEGLGLGAYHFVGEDAGVLAVQVPGLKEGRPVDVGHEVFKRVVAQREHAVLLRRGGLGAEVGLVALGTGLIDACVPSLGAAAGVLLAQAFVV